MDQKKQIVDRCNQLMALAEEKFGVDMKGVDIRFDLKGRAAGQACRRANRYFMRFNHDMLRREAFEHILNNTVPHEIAHIVCFKNPKLGRNHDAGWARVCRALGGTAERTHSEDVVYGKGYTYEYVTDTGHRVRVGDSHHKKIQQGMAYSWRNGQGRVDRFCEYWIVGHQGRTLSTPRHFPAPPRENSAPNHPARIEEAYPKPVVFTLVDQAGLGLFGNRETVTAAAPVAARPLPRVKKPAPATAPAETKATTARRIMLSGYRGGENYETIISAIMASCQLDRQLARAYFKNNAARVGIPEGWGLTSTAA